LPKAEVRIEADGTQSGEAIFQQHGVSEREKGIHRVARRTAVAGLEIELAAGHGGLQHPSELAEVQGGCLTFGAQKDRRVANGVQTAQELGHLLGSGLSAAADTFVAARLVEGTSP
jgi:hypothetical protein